MTDEEFSVSPWVAFSFVCVVLRRSFFSFLFVEVTSRSQVRSELEEALHILLHRDSICIWGLWCRAELAVFYPYLGREHFVDKSLDLPDRIRRGRAAPPPGLTGTTGSSACLENSSRRDAILACFPIFGLITEPPF